MAQQFRMLRDRTSGRSFMGFTERRFYLVTEVSLKSFTAAFAPGAVDFDGLTLDWTESDRTGLDPLLLPKSGKLKTMSFSLVLTDAYGNTNYDINGQIGILMELARSEERLFCSYGSTEAGLFRMTDCKINTTRRHPVTNEPVEGTASVTLKAASDPIAASGPLTGGAVTSPVAGTPVQSSGPTGLAPTPTTYTVSPGDTLIGIAQRIYGDPTFWTRLLDANPTIVANPSLLLTGAQLVIPS